MEYKVYCHGSPSAPKLDIINHIHLHSSAYLLTYLPYCTLPIQVYK